MASVVTDQELLDAVDEAFAVTGHGLAPWPDPHPDRMPRDEEYSRLSDPAKWRIVGARADAWLIALPAAGLAEVERNAAIRWEAPPGAVVSRADRLVPHVADGLPLIAARSHLGPVDDGGVTLGVGDPAVPIGWIPDCGCDACDSGSQDVLDELDDAIVGVVSGVFRRLCRATARSPSSAPIDGMRRRAGQAGSAEVKSRRSWPTRPDGGRCPASPGWRADPVVLAVQRHSSGHATHATRTSRTVGAAPPAASPDHKLDHEVVDASRDVHAGELEGELRLRRGRGRPRQVLHCGLPQRTETERGVELGDRRAGVRRWRRIRGAQLDHDLDRPRSTSDRPAEADGRRRWWLDRPLSPLGSCGSSNPFSPSTVPPVRLVWLVWRQAGTVARRNAGSGPHEPGEPVRSPANRPARSALR